MIQNFNHGNTAMRFSKDKDSSFGMVRFETKDMDTLEKYTTAKAPYCLKTAKDTAGPMDGCGVMLPKDSGECFFAEQTDGGLVLKYRDGALETTVNLEYIEGADVIRQTNTVVNTGNADEIITHFSSAVVTGIAMGGLLRLHDSRKIKLHHCFSHWQGEAQWRTLTLAQAGIYHKTAHSWDALSYRISSVGSWNTGRHYPLLFVEDAECGKVWYMELEGAYNWSMEVGNLNGADGGTLYLEANCADENINGFVLTLKPGESYTAPSCVYGCTDGGFEEGVRELLKYKRKTSRCGWDKPYAPACFNDYMDCLWGQPNREKLIPLIDAAAKAGCEVFCMDAGWSAVGNGTWSVNNEIYGEGGLAGIIKYICAKGMIPGIWLEIESVFKNTNLNKKELLLSRNGETVNPDRANADFTNPKVREYIMEVFDMLYDMGIRFVKNDYNLSVMIGAEKDGQCSTVGLQRTTDAFYSFIDEVKAKYPDLKIENCGSGGMRCDNGTLSHFELQSTSDQEFYYNNSSIVSGALAYLAPEKAGVWSYPYPISFYENRNKVNVWEDKKYIADRADGEETVYNMINALMGTLYLSGRIEHADKNNFALVKEGVRAFKKYRAHNAAAYPVWPDGHFTIDDDTHSSLGLISENGRKMTLAVWRRNSKEDIITVDLSKYTGKNSSVKLAYPSKPMNGADFAFNPSSGILTVKLPKQNSARFFEITCK